MTSPVRNLVSLSGGLDSCAVLEKAIGTTHTADVETVGFTYGSKHNHLENKAAKRIADYYRVPFTLIDLTEAFKGFKSNLMKDQGPIPEGHYQQDNMALTVVPGRNIIFCAILSGLAWSKGCQNIWLGVHAGDHEIYGDCRPNFLMHMRQAIRCATDNKVELQTPFMNWTKDQIVGFGITYKIPFDLTRTCYTDSVEACGKCGSCVERREAFAKNNYIDPISYQYTGPLPEKPK